TGHGARDCRHHVAFDWIGVWPHCVIEVALAGLARRRRAAYLRPSPDLTPKYCCVWLVIGNRPRGGFMAATAYIPYPVAPPQYRLLGCLSLDAGGDRRYAGHRQWLVRRYRMAGVPLADRYSACSRRVFPRLACHRDGGAS